MNGEISFSKKRMGNTVSLCQVIRNIFVTEAMPPSAYDCNETEVDILISKNPALKISYVP